MNGDRVRKSWDERYLDGEHNTSPPLEFIADLKPEAGSTRRARARALDLACGAGRHALALARNGWQVTAVDGSKVALEILNRAAKEQGLEIDCIRADLEKDEFTIEPDSWDLIVVAYYLDRQLFPVILNGVKPRGQVAFAFPREDERPGVRPMSATFLMGRGELVRHFPATNWAVRHAAEFEPDPPDRARVEILAQRLS